MKTLNRAKRLKLAPWWISAYSGKNMIRGYARHFSVDLICAITELRMLDYVGIACDKYEFTALNLIN